MRNSIYTKIVVLTLLFLSCIAPGTSAEINRVFRDGDIEIETFIYGEGADTLIIAAGNGRPAAQLEELAGSIAAGGVRVVTYNYRTIGVSKGPIVGITLHDFAEDVWRIADAMNLEKIHLAGKTYGNRVMRTAASDRPDRTLSVILIGAGGDILPTEEVQAMYWRWLDPNTPREEWQELQGELMFAPGNEHLSDRSASIGSYPQLAAAQVEASNATPKNEWASGGTAPMLVMTCLNDRVAVPENALNLAKSRLRTWLVGIPGCGHNMIYERLDDIARLTLDFISQHSTKGR